MAKRNYKYDATVDLSNLPRRTKNNYIDWKNSIGLTIPFTFDNGNLSGYFIILDYKIPDGLTHKHVYLSYEGNELKPILPIGLQKATLSNILDEFYIEWAFEIGDILHDDNRHLKIINRKRIKDTENFYRKYYQIECLKCGFDSKEHYLNGEYRKEYWVAEYDLIRQNKRRVNCPCCGGAIVVHGINDIPTTEPWMVAYFQGGYDEAKQYSKYSNTERYFKCIFCNRISNKKRKIAYLYHNGGLTCMCNDNISYPNKFAYYLFQQIKNQYSYYENEYSPDWAGLYRYDNFVIKDNKQYIVEMDGGLGHGHKQFRSNQQDIDGIKRDKIKEELADAHDITIIRIDCLMSEKEYIKNNLISKLSSIFDLSNVDWDLVDVNSRCKNVYKEICQYYNNNPKFLSEISRELNLGKKIVSSAMKIGNELGWCSYEAYNKFNEDKFHDLINYWNEHKYMRTSLLAQKFKLGQTTVIRYLKKATELGLCDYDPVKSTEVFFENKEAYHIYVFDSQLNFLKEYPSSSKCAELSMDDFGVKFNKRNIDYICCGRGKFYKGYYFSREKNIDRDEILKRATLDGHYKKVFVYTLDLVLCGEYNSTKELCENSMKDFGIQFNTANVASVCVGRYKQHKGYIFSHELLN